MSSDRVEVPRWVLGSLVGGLVLSLMGTCFLLGRASAPAPVALVTPVAVSTVASAAPVEVATATPMVIQTPAPASKPPFPGRQAEEVRAYLAAIDEVTSGTEDLGNPSDFANELLNQAVMGDTSGVDVLLEQARTAQAALARVKPPEACKQHYRLMQAEMKSSLAILAQLKAALENSDSMSLAGMASKGAAAQRQARQLEQLTRELRERSRR
ncbi:hypothetical protein JST97_12290 [bacterium]|nr:hypothetical protein [bacterium]